jgi:hypothetical protein
MFYGPGRVFGSNDEKFLYVSDTDFKNNDRVGKEMLSTYLKTPDVNLPWLYKF